MSFSIFKILKSLGKLIYLIGIILYRERNKKITSLFCLAVSLAMSKYINLFDVSKDSQHLSWMPEVVEQKSSVFVSLFRFVLCMSISYTIMFTVLLKLI